MWTRSAHDLREALANVSATSIAPPDSRRHVLLIEDSAADAVLLIDDLEMTTGAAYEVTHHVRLADGIHALAQRHTDIVLLDLSLPDSQGIEGLMRIQESAPDVAVVVMTGLDDEEVGVRMVRQGAQDYLIKGKASAESVVRVMRYAMERKAAENQLRRFADAIVEHAPIGMCVLRHHDGAPAQQVCAANTAFATMVGWDRGDLAGSDAADLPFGADLHAAAVRVRLDRAPEDLSEVSIGDRALVPSLFPMTGTLVGLALEDVTARRRAERAQQMLEVRLQQAAKTESLGVLAGGIAHDFNNLLQVIMGNLELALRELDPEEFGWARVEQAREASERAAELTRQMLVYAGRGAVEVAPTDLSELVQGMGHLLRMVLPLDTHLTYDLVEQLPAVLGDGAMLRQALMNLVTNASDAMSERPSGVISVRTGLVEVDRSYLASTFVDDALPPGRYSFVEVSDQGCGMDEATRVRIFDPFFTTKATGRGLGLASVLGIVRRHHGAIRVDSDAAGGTTVRMLLPCTTETRCLHPVSPQERPGLQTNHTVLIVDDEPLVRELASLTLRRQNFRVYTASDGVGGVEAFREHLDEIDAVLLDLTMPRMNGAEAFVAMRELRADIPVILATGYGEEAGMDAVADAPRAAVLQKPYDPGALLRLLDQLIGRP